MRLEDGLQARLLEQMRAEQAQRLRGLALRRYVLLPAVLAALVWSLAAAVSGSSTAALVGNLVASSLIWLLWKLRARLGSVFGFGGR